MKYRKLLNTESCEIKKAVKYRKLLNTESCEIKKAVKYRKLLNTESCGSIKYYSERQRTSSEALIISALHTSQTQLARELNYVFVQDPKNDTTSQDREKLKKKLYS